MEKTQFSFGFGSGSVIWDGSDNSGKISDTSGKISDILGKISNN